MKNISLELLLVLLLLLLLPSFVSFLSVDVKGYNYSSDTETEGVNLLPPPPHTHPPPLFFFLSCSLSYCFLPSSRSSIVSFYDQPFLFSAPLTLPSLPPSGL